MRRRSSERRRGLTLIEATLSMLVLSIVLVSVTQGVALSVKFQHRTEQELRGAMLAGELAERVAAYRYEDPTDVEVTKSIGRDSGEVDADWTTFDDIDDWDGYTETPPTYPDGSAMAFLSGWTREVSVGWVSRGAPGTGSLSEQGVKRIQVIVRRADGAAVGEVQRVVYETAGLGGDR